MSATWDLLANLPLTVTGYELEGRRKVWSPEFTRVTTTIHLLGAGETGLGEDVTYQQPDQAAFQEQGPVHDLAGEHTLASFAERIGSLELPVGPDGRGVAELPALGLRVRRAGPRPAPGGQAAARGRRARARARDLRQLDAPARAAVGRAGPVAPARLPDAAPQARRPQLLAR